MKNSKPMPAKKTSGGVSKPKPKPRTASPKSK